MSNGPDEVSSSHFCCEDPEDGRGQRLLVGGLGLGLIFERFQLEQDPPDHVVVVEINPHVIELVFPTYESLPWLEVVEGDIWEWLGNEGPERFPKYFDTAWMDIWGDYSTDLLEEMFALRRKCRRVMRKGGGRVKIWQEGFLKYQRERDKGAWWNR